MTDNDFYATVQAQGATSLAEDKQTGAPVAGSMAGKCVSFLKELFALIDSGTLNVDDPQTFLNHDVYDALDETWQDKADLALINLASQLQLIKKFRDDPAIPDESPQLETMVEQLWEMKQRIEEHHDVFIF